jgi:hypothetical protein
VKSRFRFYLKLFVALFAVAVTATLLWFIFRIEVYLLSRLPKEITVEKLSVSFLNQAFVITGAKVAGKPGTTCEGKTVLEVAEATGKFRLKERKLTELQIKAVTVKTEALKRGCFVKPGDKPDLKLGDGVGPEGLKIQITDGVVPVPEFGDLTVQAVFSVRENEHGAAVAHFEKLHAENPRLAADAKKIALAFVKGRDAVHLSDGEIMATVKLNRLEKISKLSTKKLRVLSGDAELRISADIRRGDWTLYTAIDLRHMKLTGEPLYNMPLLKLTPENMWPMVEDSPGLFSFSFKTHAPEIKLAKTYAADFRNAITRKIKGNLKKKIPVLPL